MAGRPFRLSRATKVGLALAIGGCLCTVLGYAAAMALHASGLFVDALEVLILLPLTFVLIGAPLVAAVVGVIVAFVGLVADFVRW